MLPMHLLAACCALLHCALSPAAGSAAAASQRTTGQAHAHGQLQAQFWVIKKLEARFQYVSLQLVMVCSTVWA